MAFLPDNTVQPRVVTTWDSLPPVVEAYGETFSTRVLAYNYSKMQKALESIRDHGLDAKQCRDAASDALTHVI